METVEAQPAAAAAQAAPAPAPAPAPSLTAPVEKSWSEVVVLANGSIGPKEGRPVIVVETRGDDGKLVDGRAYPTTGDLYYRTDPDVDFGIDPAKPLLTLGVNLGQHGFKGFATKKNGVHVGPASPIYAAANLAFQRGATTIDVVGLTAAQKDQLAPWFDELSSDPSLPQGLKVNLT